MKEFNPSAPTPCEAASADLPAGPSFASKVRANPYRVGNDHEFGFAVCAENLHWSETLFRAIDLASKHEQYPATTIQSLAGIGMYLTEQAGGSAEEFERNAKRHADELEAAEQARVQEARHHAR